MENEKIEFVSQAEAARRLGRLRNRIYSRSYINRLTNDSNRSIRMSGTNVCWEDIRDMPSRQEFVGRPRKKLNEDESDNNISVSGDFVSN